MADAGRGAPPGAHAPRPRAAPRLRRPAAAVRRVHAADRARVPAPHAADVPDPPAGGGAAAGGGRQARGQLSRFVRAAESAALCAGAEANAETGWV